MYGATLYGKVIKNLKFKKKSSHGVQRRMIPVDNFFVFLRLFVCALLLLYVT